LGQSVQPADSAEPLGFQAEGLRGASPEPRADPGDIQRRALQGILSLIGREAAGKLLGLAGGIVLARLLEPAAFGLFAIGLFVISVPAFLNDAGLGAAFIRRPGEASRRELDAVFTFQLALVLILAVLLFFAAPFVARGYGAPELTWLLRALTIVLVLRSLRLVPVIIAERRLDYGRVAVAEFAGQVGYWLAAVAAALAGFGVWSLALAMIALSGLDVAVLYARAGWRPRVQFDWSPIRGQVSFGLMYKSQAAAGFVRDMLFSALGGVAYGSVAVGYLTWAQQITWVPQPLTQVVCRVIYPALGKLHHDRAAFVETVEAALKWTCRLTLPALAVLAGLAPEIIELVYGPKWLPALPALYLLTVNMALGVGTGVLMTALYAQGRVGLALRISLASASMTWFTALGLVMAGAGFGALAAASTLGTALALAVLIGAVPDLPVRAIWRATRRSVLSAGGVGVALHLMAPVIVHGLASLAVLGIMSGAAVAAINVWDERSGALAAARWLMAPHAR
jgi:O-antigen/teichoic acid export membrane protein